jgi:hypothetical protein
MRRRSEEMFCFVVVGGIYMVWKLSRRFIIALSLIIKDYSPVIKNSKPFPSHAPLHLSVAPVLLIKT